MSEFVKSAVFVFSSESSGVKESIVDNNFGVPVVAVELDSFLENPTDHLKECSHVVVAAGLAGIKSVLQLSIEHSFSVGIIPSRGTKKLRAYYGLPSHPGKLIEVALGNSPQVMDLVFANDEIVLINATLGRLPLLDTSKHRTKFGLVLSSLGMFFGIRLKPFSFVTSVGSKIKTAACGCMIIQPHKNSAVSRLLSNDSSFTDGMVSLVVAAPMSILEYLKFVFQFFKGKIKQRQMPSTLGYIKSSEIKIETEPPLKVLIDGSKETRTPLRCRVEPAAVRINIGKELRSRDVSAEPMVERIDVHNLPAGRELSKARDKRIPFFAYASEERFRDLFMALRADTKINSMYVILMILSTLLATLGLFLSSASVVIGAMLIAPLMDPIASLSMGLVRQDNKLSVRSIKKIIVGIIIAIISAAALSLMIAHKPVTAEMQARLNPSLLDLGVAILAGVAAAYTKAYKEILHSLAGVAIAVALVPPLAVAGIGLGRADLLFFYQAFLLFFTNLVGITVAATLTFRFLGYSPAVQNKKGLAVAVLLLLIVSVPLYLSYQTIAEKQTMERNWKSERFIVDSKYLIVQKATLQKQRHHDVLYIDVLTREPLTRTDLAVLKKKVQMHFNKRLIVRANITYIL
ncbi:MAG: TIGR00341 family protein [Kiritimatiellae bacterium]|nr:TIGR00341 family protein [Kiritimatiellia bacterium]